MLKSWWSSVQCLLICLVWYVNFCRLVPKGTETPCVISGVGELIFTKIVQNVAKIVPFNTCKSELRFSNPLRNANMLNKGHFANFAQNRLSWQRPLRNQTKRCGSKNNMQIPFIWWKNCDIRSSRSWEKEEINASKIYSPVGKCAEQVKLAMNRISYAYTHELKMTTFGSC